MNKLIPIQTRAGRAEQRREYKKENKDKIKEYNETRKEKVNCECGGVYTLDHKHHHVKTNKHLIFLGQADICIAINNNCPCGGHYPSI